MVKGGGQTEVEGGKEVDRGDGGTRCTRSSHFIGLVRLLISRNECFFAGNIRSTRTHTSCADNISNGFKDQLSVMAFKSVATSLCIFIKIIANILLTLST